MSVRTVLTRLLAGDETEVVVECRQCGENLTSSTNKCPKCGSDEIERFGSVEILRELHVRPVIRRDEAPPEVADSPVY